MMKKQDLQDELREISPLLGDLKSRGNDAFRVPEGYFSGLENEVFATIDAIGACRKPVPETAFSARVGQWLAAIWPPKLALAMAGTFALALGAWWLLRPAPDAPAAVAAVEISEEDAESFVLAHVADFEPTQLVPENVEDLPNPIHESIEKNGGIHDNDLELLLDDMTDEELEELL